MPADEQLLDFCDPPPLLHGSDGNGHSDAFLGCPQSLGEYLDGQADEYAEEAENTIDPKILWADKKPPVTFAQLIRAAILSSDRQRLYLHEIYGWISTNFPYYRREGSGWKVCKDALA